MMQMLGYSPSGSAPWSIDECKATCVADDDCHSFSRQPSGVSQGCVMCGDGCKEADCPLRRTNSDYDTYFKRDQPNVPAPSQKGPLFPSSSPPLPRPHAPSTVLAQLLLHTNAGLALWHLFFVLLTHHTTRQPRSRPAPPRRARPRARLQWTQNCRATPATASSSWSSGRRSTTTGTRSMGATGARRAAALPTG